MATQKQVDALIRIVGAIRRNSGKPPLTLAEVANARAEIEAMTPDQVRAQFKRLNAITGFDPHSSDATPDQRRLIERLERRVYGGVKTTYRTKLSYAHAGEVIQELIAERNKLEAAKGGAA